MPNPWARWGLYFLFWTFWGLLNAGSAVIEVSRAQPALAPWKPISWELTSLYTTALLFPLMVRFTLAHPFTRRDWGRKLLLHLPAVVLFSLLHTSGFYAMRLAVYAVMGEFYDFARGELALQYLYEFYKDVRLYWLIVFLSYGFEYFNKFRERELVASRLETRLVEAQLENLKGQLNPHFLFNTLNMISSFMYEDVPRADRMMTRLSDFLRRTLESSQQARVTLRQELKTLGIYLEIMQARFQDRLSVTVEVAPSIEEAMVPNLIFQPLVENAVRHGISKRGSGGTIRIEAIHERGTLILRVRDDGSGSPESEAELFEKGFGLSNTAERLRRLYGDEQRISLRTRQGKGFEVEVAFPYQSEKELEGES